MKYGEIRILSQNRSTKDEMGCFLGHPISDFSWEGVHEKENILVKVGICS